MFTRIQLSLLLLACGCAVDDAGKYVGTWGGRSSKANEGFAFTLNEGGDGYAATFVGAAPLKWRESAPGRLDVRFGCGDGSMTICDLVYSPGERTLVEPCAAPCT